MDGRLIATRQGAVATGLLVTFALAVSVTAGVALLIAGGLATGFYLLLLRRRRADPAA